MSWRACFNGERNYRDDLVKTSLGEAGACVWYRGHIKDAGAEGADEMVVSLESDLTRSVAASGGDSGADRLDG